VWALVPQKAFARSKSRLASILSPEERAAFAKRCFLRVLDALDRSAQIAGITVLTDHDEVAAMARAHGASVLADQGGLESVGALVNEAIADLSLGAQNRILVIMADLPFVTTEDIDDIIAAQEPVDVVVAADRHAVGTNAILMDLPAPMATSFTLSESLRRHQEDARLAGLSMTTHVSRGLSCDVDTDADWADLGLSQPAPTALRDSP